jgi:hypothetical protein
MQGEVSKGEFAALIGVTPGRVSQYIAAGQIKASSLVGSGRNAKVDVEKAKADLRLTLDISQRLGNGIDTNLGSDDPADRQATAIQQSSSPPIQISGVEHDIKQAKLEQLRRINRNGAIAEAKDRGQLIETELARAEMARVAASMLQVFEGGLTDIASAITAEFKIPQRDLLHLMRKQFRIIRERGAQQMRSHAVSLPDTVETELAADDIESLN